MFGGLDDATSLRVGRRWCSPTPPGEDSDKGPAEEVGERTGEEPLSVFCEECEAEMLTEGVDYNFTLPLHATIARQARVVQPLQASR